MLTKQQKQDQIKNSVQLLKKSQNLVFADFTGVGVNDLKKLRVILKKSGAIFKVVKKRLLKIALKEMGIDFDPKQFAFQLGTVFAPIELTSLASQIYKFSKDLSREKKEFKILGAYDLAGKSFLNSEQFVFIAKLPSREVLLAQVVGMLAVPIRNMLYVLTELSKKSANAQSGNQ